MESPTLKAAMFYHNEGLNVIPVIHKDKRPALAWEEYHTRKSTQEEIAEWFNRPANIGIVHGAVSDNYITLDLDHDQGIFEAIKTVFPEMTKGRIEQSGSLEGYHVPLRLKALPDFGYDAKLERLKGNKTWKTMIGVVNIRAQFCQSVSPTQKRKSTHANPPAYPKGKWR
jgi:hypothetical protein